MSDDHGADPFGLQWGEYHMTHPRAPFEIASLRERDKLQDERLGRLEDGQVVIVEDIKQMSLQIRAISTTLHGEHGDNGLRMDVRAVQHKLDRLPVQIAGAIGGVLAGGASLVAIIAGIRALLAIAGGS